jgi:tRNA(Ile)-lysidine synthase
MACMNKLWVAFSGGLDSHCLLHMYATGNLPLPKDTSLNAVHINHNLSPHAADWQQHCQQICEKLTVPYHVEAVTITRQPGESLEALARDARYTLFKQLLITGDKLVTAHHADDQSETFLLQATRGAGIKGLACMPRERALGEGVLQRPLLDFTQAQLQAYALTHNLTWVEDESNQDTNFNRNYLRHNVMPVLQNRWPSLHKSIQQISGYCAEAAILAEALAKIDINNCLQLDQSLSIENLSALDLARQKNVLRYWLTSQQVSLPSGPTLQRIFSELIPAAHDAQPQISWGNNQIRRFNQRLYLLSESLPTAPKAFEWNWKQQQANLKAIVAEQGIAAKTLPTTLQVKFRLGGQRFKLVGCDHSQSLKKLLQAWQVPPWQRDYLPLICDGETLLAAPPYYNGITTSDDDCIHFHQESKP